MSEKRPSDNDDQPGNRVEENTPTEGGFGSFVSDSVRRSASRFKKEGEQSPSRRRGSREGEPTEPDQPDERFRTAPRQGRGALRPGERQRQYVPVAPPEPESDTTPNAGAATLPLWAQEAIDRAGGTDRAITAGAILLVAVVALIWLLTAVLGGDDQEFDPTPTEALQVLPIGDQGTPTGATEEVAAPDAPVVEDDQFATATEAADQEDTGQTPTRRGSDNVLDRLPSTPAADSRSPTASCDTDCLVRVERTPEAAQLLTSAGTRPSYAGDNWYWVIAEPTEIAEISSTLAAEVVRENTDTLRLYMVVLPSADANDDAAEQFGDVIDSVDSYRLVESATAPANVRSLLDAGFTVEKVAPATLEMRQRSNGLPQLTEGDIAGLMNEVDSSRIEETIGDLQIAGAADGGTIGTRHYTTAGNQVAAEYLYQKLESYGLDVWYEDFVSWDGLLLVNVVGEIPGRDTSRLYGVMAHFDTISESSGTAAPGADDNASGIAASLEIARVLAEYDLAYSLRVVFVNYEEEGVVGSQEFARDAVEAGDPWEGIFNIDSVGSARNGNQIVLNADGSSVWMEELIQRVDDAYGLADTLVMHQSDEIVADDTRLRSEGIESVLVARELYGWSPVHHTADDVLESMSIPHTEQAAVLILLTTASLLS